MGNLIRPGLLRHLQTSRDGSLAITTKPIRALGPDLDLEQPPAPPLPDGAPYQQIMDVFDYERRPLRGRDLCQALDLPIAPKHVEGTRAKLKRLVSLGLLDETEPGLFAQPRPQAPPAPADLRS